MPRHLWLHERAEHIHLVAAWTGPRLARRAKGLRHPVDDFLFDYYPISPGRLRTWHPGIDRELEAAESDMIHFPEQVYRWHSGAIHVDPQWLTSHQAQVERVLDLLEAVASRPARIGCNALHEWAMVLDAAEVRHTDYPLRVSNSVVRETVEQLGLRCTHFDAFRFFTPPARPLNHRQLTRTDQYDTDQPGCLHANMDLYRHAVTLSPIVGSTTVRDCFQLAREIRTVDMQVAPYDLTALGVLPIPIETEAGRRLFDAAQRSFAERATVLRHRLVQSGRVALATR